MTENLLAHLTPKPCSRSLITGQVGSGKSTLGAVLLDSYHSLHPSHPIVVIDPKERFIAVKRYEDNGRIFPDGYESSNHGRIRGVSINARILSSGTPPKVARSTIMLVRGVPDALNFFDWALSKYDVRNPFLIYCDETQPFMDGRSMADPSLSLIIQTGREKGLGIILVTQLLRHIDGRFISEAEKLFIGTLHSKPDKKKLVDHVNVAHPEDLMSTVPRRHFWLIDREHDVKQLFTLKLENKAA